MSGDLEIEAMTALVAVLDKLDPAIRGRVISWAANRWDESIASMRQSMRASGKIATTGTHDDDLDDTAQARSFADLYEATSPATDVLRALVGAFWLQVCQQQENFTSQQVNDELKHLGHAVGNITDAFSGLQKQAPSLARQIKKSGSSKQARKQFQLTTAGIKHVESMIAKAAKGEG